MSVGHNGVKQPVPWFSANAPWPYWGQGHSGKTIAAGSPQHVLTNNSSKYGFNANVSFDVSPMVGNKGGPFPATLGAVLNLSAAQIASAPAFQKNNLYD
jgi:hypothetical protein